MIARTDIVTGPARLVRGSGSVHVRESFEVLVDKPQFQIILEGYGPIDSRDEDAMVTTGFTPDGRWNAATRAFLWPYLNPTIGSDPFGSSDTPTVIHDSNAHVHTIIASAITQMPSLVLSAVTPMIGQATITGIRGTAKDWNDANGLYTVATSGGTFTDSGFIPSEIQTVDYTGVWGSVTGFGAIKTQAGWTIDFNTGIEFFKLDEVGTCKASLVSVEVLARCMPIGISAANVLAALDVSEAGSARGKSGNVLAADIVITGAGGGAPVVTLKSAKLVKAGYRFGARVLREGELGWVATRNFSSGVAGALCTLA